MRLRGDEIRLLGNMQRWLFVVFVLALARVAAADIVPMVPVPTWDYTASVFQWQQGVQRNYEQHLNDRRPTGKKPAGTTTSGAARIPARLAASYPKAQRAEAQRAFQALLDGYAKIEASLNVAKGDLVGATALLVVAAYEAYADTAVDTAAYPKILEQLRTRFVSQPGLASITASERRALYEQMAVLGMMLLTTRAQHPDAATRARMRDAAASYLRGLSLDPATLRIDRGGISVAP